MHISDILMYGHLTVQRTVETFPAAEVGTAGACGYWSVKDLVAHLGSYELVLVDILDGFINPGSPTPHLEAFIRPDYNFNDEQVNQRQGMTFAEVYAEYQAAHAQVRDLAAQIPADLWQQSGALPWYGAASQARALRPDRHLQRPVQRTASVVRSERRTARRSFCS